MTQRTRDDLNNKIQTVIYFVEDQKNGLLYGSTFLIIFPSLTYFGL